MIPKIAIVGRPNVGKSALFNAICKKRISIVDDREGITRDRLYAKTDLFGRPFEIIDTGGIDHTGTVAFNEEIRVQALYAVEECDGIIFVVDGQLGLHPLDLEVAKILRRSKKPLVVAVNKIDSPSDELKVHEFQSLGLPGITGVSAMQSSQIAELLELILDQIEMPEEEPVEEEKIVKVAIVGRPNVGKSTLLNELLGEHRSIVSPIAGTTRDAIDAPIVVNGKTYLLIDTAGIRRKKAEKEVVDKFAAIRTDEAIARADVCLLLIDAEEGMTGQEKRIANEIEFMGKSCVILFNKWDLVKQKRMEHAMSEAHDEAPFLAHCETIFLSALKRRNLDKIFPAIDNTYVERHRKITTGQLNKFIEACLQKYHPPLIIGKRLRIYYMTQSQVAPPKFIVFVNNPTLMVDAYKKYLINQFRKTFLFTGTPIFFELRGRARRTMGHPDAPQASPEEETAEEPELNVEFTEPLLIDE